MLFLQERHTGASYSDGDVPLGVGETAADTRARSPQDHRGSVDWSAAVLVALLAIRSIQAALTQTVGLRNVAGIPSRVIGDPEEIKITWVYIL